MNFATQENNHPYYVEFRRQLDKFHKGLSADITLTTTLPTETRNAVISYLLELACQSQTALNIEIGRKALLALPKEWLIANIEPIAKPLLLLESEWEYRRLVEVYLLLDRKLACGLIKSGINSKNPTICEAAQDYQEQ
jgi:hypothetical protein